MAEKRKLFLLDAMALIYRAYFAFSKNPRINSKGLNTSAVLGFANSLFDVIRNEKPTHIGVAFDSFAPTLRHEDFEGYKANREKMPEDLADSIPYVKQLIEAFNIPILILEGYEADDIIGTVAKKAEKEDFEVYMMTPDKDFGQLVTEKIFMYKPARMGNKAEIMGVPEVCAKFGIEKPEQLIDILGLWGDASDNIPGIPGIGEKTASKLIMEYGSMEALFENTDKLKGKMKENVIAFEEQGRMSKELAKIILDVPLNFDAEELKLQKPDFPELKALFDELEFRNFAQRIANEYAETEDSGQASLFDSNETGGPKKLADVKHDYHLVQTANERKSLIGKLTESKSFCFDTETTGLDPNDAEIIGISFCIDVGEAWYVALPDNYHETLDIISEFKGIFENKKIGKTGQNLKYDIAMLRWYEVEVKGPIFDTMLAHYLLEPDMRHNMDYLARNYLDYECISIESLIGKKGKNQKSMRSVPAEVLKDYACEDADITFQLRQVFEPELKETETLELLNKTEMPLVPVLATMETEGVRIDSETMLEYSKELGCEIETIEKTIYDHAGLQFNISSPKQLGEILFEKLKVDDKPKLTKTKQYSTSEDVLQKLKGKHPVIENILDFRSLTKLKSTYVDALPALINLRTKRIHTSYNQAVTATGRLSSTNPNLQNIPIRTDRGREIRKAFVPRNNDFILLAADYSQIELRIIASMSGDEAMKEAFINNIDIHTATAAKVYGVSPEEVNRDMRRNAKTVNFGIIYGISAFGLSERLGIARYEAADIIKQYFKEFPGIKQYMDDTIAFARENGYVKTLLGRRRYLRDINSANAVVRNFAERNAINAPIQGSSADMIKIAMIRIHKEIFDQKLRSRMVMQVHDELVFDTYKEENEILREIIIRNMKEALPLDVPIEVDINQGNNWLEAH